MTAPLRRPVLLFRNVWQGHQSSLPWPLEVLLGLAKTATDRPKRRFRTCTMPRCGRVFYGVLELCKECRQTQKDKQ